MKILLNILLITALSTVYLFPGYEGQIQSPLTVQSVNEYMSTTRVPAPTGKRTTPAELLLFQNIPNPVGAETEITFYLPFKGPVGLTVVDTSGVTVLKLVDAFLPAGYHTVSLQAEQLKRGEYTYCLTTLYANATRIMKVSADSLRLKQEQRFEDR